MLLRVEGADGEVGQHSTDILSSITVYIIEPAVQWQALLDKQLSVDIFITP